MGVISIGTDTDGSILGPASYNGVFGLRPPHGQTFNDGIFIILESDDTVGPLAHHVEDIVLAYSVMIDNPTLYDNYLDKQLVKPTEIRIGYLVNFLSDFTLDFGENIVYHYKLDAEVIEAFHKTVKNLKAINIDVVEMEIPDEVFDVMLADLKDIYNARGNGCISKCLKSTFDIYFGNQNRFQNDSLYHSADDVKNSSFLSPYFKDILNNNNFNTTECSKSCIIYQELKELFAKRIESWYKISSPEVDLLIFPTTTIIPQKLDNTEAEKLFSATFIPPLSGYAALNIPVFYSNPKSTAPNGLPVGVMLIASEDNFPKMLKIAGYYEEKYLKNKKLPKNVPQLQSKCFSNANKHSLSSIFLLIASLILLINF